MQSHLWLFVSGMASHVDFENYVENDQVIFISEFEKFGESAQNIGPCSLAFENFEILLTHHLQFIGFFLAKS